MAEERKIQGRNDAQRHHQQAPGCLGAGPVEDGVRVVGRAGGSDLDDGAGLIRANSIGNRL